MEMTATTNTSDPCPTCKRPYWMTALASIRPTDDPTSRCIEPDGIWCVSFALGSLREENKILREACTQAERLVRNAWSEGLSDGCMPVHMKTELGTWDESFAKKKLDEWKSRLPGGGA